MATIDHVAAVVKDLDAAIKVMKEGFGFKSRIISQNDELGIRVCLSKVKTPQLN
jgi:hypothetical protein